MLKKYKIEKYYVYDDLDFYVEYEVLKQNDYLECWDNVDYADTYDEAIGVIKRDMKEEKDE